MRVCLFALVLGKIFGALLSVCSREPLLATMFLPVASQVKNCKKKKIPIALTEKHLSLLKCLSAGELAICSTSCLLILGCFQFVFSL